MSRKAEESRETTETRIHVVIDLDGRGEARIATGIGFFDHMLDTLARHSRMDIGLEARGDLDRDDHHTVEDAGICLGAAVRKALGDKAGIQRYGWAYCPMDEALARAVLDLSGRPWFAFRRDGPDESLRGIAGDSCLEFFRAFASECRSTLHLDLLRGRNRHHALEAMFKSFAHALGQAVRIGHPGGTVLSTKGAL